MLGVFAAFDDDDFRWWISQLADAGRPGEVHRTMGHLDSNGVNAWFAARDARNEVAGYASDLARAWELAEVAPASGEAVGLQCRYALIHALLGDLASRFKPKLATELVRGGVWNRNQALAWSRLNFDPESGLELMFEALAAAEGTQREVLLLRAVRSTADFVTEIGPMRLAELAQSAAPHEKAQLLDGILNIPDRGGLVGGLCAIVPQLPSELLPRVRRALPGMRAVDDRIRVIAALAQRASPDQQSTYYDEMLVIARSALVGLGQELSGARDRIFHGLVGALPIELLPQVLQLATDTGLTGYGYEKVTGAVLARMADVEPDWAIRHEFQFTDVRDRVFAAACRGFARQRRFTEALAAAASVSLEMIKAPAIVMLAGAVEDVEDEALLAEVARLASLDSRIQVLRVLAGRAGGPSTSLLKVADACSDTRDRLRARTAMTSALPMDEVGATLEQILKADAIDEPSLAGLAPVLTAEQARRSLDTLQEWSVFNYGTALALVTRLADLGHADEALGRVAQLSDPHQLERPSALAALASRMPDRLLPALRNAVRPASVAAERVAARAELSRHLPSTRIAEIVAEAAALPHPGQRARAFALLAAAGHRQAVAALPTAVRETCAKRHLHPIALDAIRLVSTSGQQLPADLADAATRLRPMRNRMLGLVLLALSGRSAGAASAAAMLVRLLAAGHDLPEDNERIPGHLDSLCLEQAVLDLPTDEQFARAMHKAAPYLAGADAGRSHSNRTNPRTELIRRAHAIDQPDARLLALISLATIDPTLATCIAREELARKESWTGNPTLLVLGLKVLTTGGMPVEEALVHRAWEEVPRLDPPARVAQVTSLADLHVPFPISNELTTVAARSVLNLQGRLLWMGITGLARRLGRDELKRVAGLLALAEASTSEEFVRAAAACAVRAAELGDDMLAVELLSAAHETPARQAPVAIAANRLPPSTLRAIADSSVNRSDDQVVIATAAGMRGDERLVKETLDNLREGSRREQVLISLAQSAPARWVSWLLPMIRQLREGPRAEALAALAIHGPHQHSADLALEAVGASHGLRGARAPERGQVLRSLRPVLAQLPATTLAKLWTEVMHIVSPHGRHEILVDVAALAAPLVEVFGVSSALSLDDAVRLGGADAWPQVFSVRPNEADASFPVETS